MEGQRKDTEEAVDPRLTYAMHGTWVAIALVPSRSAATALAADVHVVDQHHLLLATVLDYTIGIDYRPTAHQTTNLVKMESYNNIPP